METMEIVALYVGLAAAIVAGVALLWCLLEELVGFDSTAHRPRSSRVEAPPASPVDLAASPTPRPDRLRPKAAGVSLVHGTLH
jgi:hypothetical protein